MRPHLSDLDVHILLASFTSDDLSYTNGGLEVSTALGRVESIFEAQQLLLSWVARDIPEQVSRGAEAGVWAYDRGSRGHLPAYMVPLSTCR